MGDRMFNLTGQLSSGTHEWMNNCRGDPTGLCMASGSVHPTLFRICIKRFQIFENVTNIHIIFSFNLEILLKLDLKEKKN